MFFTGIFEELLFRCFLFKMLLHKNTITAILFSSIGFGFAHLFNLIGGAELIPTLLQVCYASAIGFSFTIFFYKTHSIIPCMICHSMVDMVYVIAPSNSLKDDIIFTIIVSVCGIGYAIYLLTKKSFEKNTSINL